MANKKANSIKLKRGTETRHMPINQWEAMKKGSTYGWVPASEISEDVKTAETQAEASRTKQLETELAEAKETIKEKDQRIAELKERFESHMKHDALLEKTNNEIAKDLEAISDVKALDELLSLESRGQKRKGASEAIQNRIDSLKARNLETVSTTVDNTAK